MPLNDDAARQAEYYLEQIEEHGGIRAAGRALGVPEATIRYRIKSVLEAEGEPEFTSHNLPEPNVYRPLATRPRYFILTAAQDGTEVHKGFWNALRTYSSWLGDCEILVSGFTYNKALFENHDKRSEDVFFDPLVNDYITHDRALIGNDEDGIDFCGEMNTLPTAARPLSGFQTYTRHRWGIFPHTKVQLESVPTMKRDRSKQIMTTGAVTLPDYVRKKAGIKAEFHHVIGAVLVELCPDGSTFARHLLANSNSDGTFYDLDRRITPKTVYEGCRVEGLTYGDIHHEKLDPVVAKATWGYDVASQTRASDDCLQTFLDPKHEFFHDLSDFAPRNHHNISDHHFRFANHVRGGQYDSVEEALRGCSKFISEIAHAAGKQVIVTSNHDQALIKWLKTADYRTDPQNACFFLKWQSWFYDQLANGISDPDPFQCVLREMGVPSDTIFVNEDSSYLLCDEIECGMHGHLGANGARANPNQFVKSGSKSNTGHTHSPTIIDGAYVAGVSGMLDMGYNKGLSSWAHAHIVTYPNGKRAILTMHNGRFHASDRHHGDEVFV